MERIKNRYSVVTPEINDQYAFASQVSEGLSGKKKSISSIYFYDEEGSKLFEEICTLPEYYLTRAETGILKKYAGQIIARLPVEATLVELGSGSSVKTTFLIEEMLHRFNKTIYRPIDVSHTMLHESSVELLRQYPALKIESIAAPYDIALEELNIVDQKARMIIWLGSSIGNFDRAESVVFLNGLVKNLKENDRLLIGMDMRKDPELLEKAYNDLQGVTAKFNLNLLNRINTELGGTFDLNQFRHRAIYNVREGRIEMYLESKIDQDVYIREIDKTFHFDLQENIHTENSYKYSQQEIEMLSEKTGMVLTGQWFDKDNYFSLNMFRRDSEN